MAVHNFLCPCGCPIFGGAKLDLMADCPNCSRMFSGNCENSTMDVLIALECSMHVLREHAQNILEQLVHPWLKVPPECLRINIRAFILQNYWGDVPPDPSSEGVLKAHPLHLRRTS